MESAVEKRIKEMKETAEKVQQLKKEVSQAQTAKKETTVTVKREAMTPAKSKTTSSTKADVVSGGEKSESLAWSTGVKCDIPFYLL